MPLSRRSLLVALVLTGGAAGCQDDISTPFPPGLEPLEDNLVPDAEGPPVEELRTWEEDGDVRRAHGRGYLFGDPATLWAIAQEPDVMVARCRTDAQRVTVGNEPTYAYSFLASYTVNMIVTVEWDDQWRYGIIEGTADAPTFGMIRHQKVEGSAFIRLSTGTVQLLATADPQITEVAFVELLDAVSGDAGDLRNGMIDNYNRMRARLRGEAFPPCP